MIVLEIMFSLIVCLVAAKILWTSTLMLDARKKAYRDGTHDYYGNKIEKDEKNS